jgi:hypothetical protein
MQTNTSRQTSDAAMCGPEEPAIPPVECATQSFPTGAEKEKQERKTADRDRANTKDPIAPSIDRSIDRELSFDLNKVLFVFPFRFAQARTR